MSRLKELETEVKTLVPAEIFIEHTCDYADLKMQDVLGRSYEDYLLGNDDEGYSYTEAGQEIFDEYLGEAEDFLAKFGVVNGVIEETEDV